jgi:hypothetical protein
MSLFKVGPLYASKAKSWADGCIDIPPLFPNSTANLVGEFADYREQGALAFVAFPY